MYYLKHNVSFFIVSVSDIDACDPALVPPGEQPPCNNNPCKDIPFDRECDCDSDAGFVGKYCQGMLCKNSDR